MSCPESLAPRPLILVGDSHLARFDLGRLERLASALGGRVLVHNHAVGGANSVDLVQRAPVEAATRGALFVVSVGTNDLAPWKRVPLTEFSANAGRLLEALGGRRSVVLLPPAVDEASQARAHGELGRTNTLVGEYGKILAEVAHDAGSVVVDLAALLAGKRDVHEVDGVHLNADGYAVVIPAIATGVRPLLAD